MFEINQLASLDIPIIVILLSALFIYFGEVLSTKVEKYDK